MLATLPPTEGPSAGIMKLMLGSTVNVNRESLVETFPEAATTSSVVMPGTRDGDKHLISFDDT
jgi:hypothetical protein